MESELHINKKTGIVAAGEAVANLFRSFVGAKKEQKLPVKPSGAMGHIGLKANDAVKQNATETLTASTSQHGGTGEAIAPKVKYISREELSERVEAKAKDQPVGRKLEVVLEEAGSDVNPQIQTEVRRLAQLLDQDPSRKQWENIQKSVWTISSYSDTKVIEIAKTVQAEVEQYAFSHVATHAAAYELTAAKASEVADTFRHASSARFRAKEEKAMSAQISPPEVQQAMEKALVDAEIEREWQTTAEIVGRVERTSDVVESDRKAKEMRELEEVTIEEARGRIQDLIKNFPSEEAEWMQQLLDATKENKLNASFLLSLAEAGPDAVRNPAYLFTKGMQLRALHMESLMKEPAGQVANEARALERAMKDKTLELQSKPPRIPPKHLIDFPLQKSTVEALMMFEGRTMGKPYAIPTEYPWWQEPLPGHKLKFYGTAGTAERIHGDITDPHFAEFNTFLEGVQSAVDLDPRGIDAYQTISYLDRQFDNMLQNFQRNPANVGVAIPRDLQLYKIDLHELTESLYKGQGRGWMNLDLSVDRKELIWDRGLEEIRDQMRLVEEFSRSHEADSPKAQEAMRVLDKMFEYIDSPDYIEDFKNHLIGQQGTNIDMNMIEQRIISLKNNEIPELSTEIGLRRLLINIFNAYNSQGIPPDKLAQFISPLGSEGVQFISGLKNGAVGAVVNYMDEVVSTGRWRPHGFDKIWYSEDKFLDFYNEATNDLAGPLGLTVAPKLGLTQAELMDEANRYKVEEISFLALELHTIGERKPVAIVRGISPIESGFNAPGEFIDLAHPFAGGGGNMSENIAGSILYNRFGDERWLQMRKGPKAMKESGATFASLGNHCKDVVDAIVDDAQNRGRMEDLVRRLCNITGEHMNAANWQSVVEERLKAEYHTWDLRGHDRKPPTTLQEAAANVPLLKERLMVKIGSEFKDRSIMSYTFYDSGPATTQTINQMKAMFRHGDELAVNMRIRAAYQNVLGAGTHHDKEGALAGLRTTLEHGAQYNPNDLLKPFIDHWDFATEAWMNSLAGGNPPININTFLHDSEIAAGVTSVGDLSKVVGKRGVLIEELIKDRVKAHAVGANEPHLRINWLEDLSPEHTEIVRQALRAFKRLPEGTDAQIGLNDFVNLMKSMSEHVGSEAQIEKLLRPDYLDFGYHTQGLYDCWLDIAERPDLGDMPNTAQRHRLSYYFGRMGRGGGDLLIRAYGDAATALNAKQMIFDAETTMDYQAYLKAIREIQRMTTNVYGTPWDGRAVMYITAGLFEQATPDAISEITFGLLRGIVPKDSPLRRIISEHAESWFVEERYEKLGQLENVIMQNLHDFDQELAHTFMQYVGLNFKSVDLPNGKLWAKRFYSVAMVVALLVVVESTKEGLPELGAGGGGGGGEHH